MSQAWMDDRHAFTALRMPAVGNRHTDAENRAAKAMHNAADDYVGKRPHMDGDTERAFLSGWEAGVAWARANPGPVGNRHTDKPREWQCSCDERYPIPVVARSDYLEAVARAERAEADVIRWHAKHDAYFIERGNALERQFKEQLTACQRERDEIKARIAEIQYAAMKSGDTVRSLYAGSEVSKRILALREENDALKAKLGVCVEALEEARNHAGWATAQVQIKDAYNCANRVSEVINEALAKLKESK